jgi:hypothetical protein
MARYDYSETEWRLWPAPIEWSNWDVSLGLVLAPARARLA